MSVFSKIEIFCLLEVDKLMNIFQPKLHFVSKRQVKLQTIYTMKKVMFWEKSTQESSIGSGSMRNGYQFPINGKKPKN